MKTEMNWIDEYYDWLRDSTIAKNLSNGWTAISTPFMDRHNDGLTIYAKQEGTDITLSDDGYIISDLKADGVSLSSAARKQRLDSFLAGYGVININGELTVRATRDNYPQKKHMLIQAMLAVNDMFLLSDKNVKSIFLEDVAAFFEKNDIVNTPNVNIVGESGLVCKIDFVIPAIKKRNKPERMIRTCNAPREDFIKSLLFEWTDAKKKRSADSELIAILNDKKAIDGKIFTALETYNARPMLWSKMNEYVGELSIA